MWRAGLVVLSFWVLSSACAGSGGDTDENVPATEPSPTVAATGTTTEPPPEVAAQAALETLYADAVAGIDDPEMLALFERVKENTIAFADPELALAAGYEKSPNGCDPGAGLHYVNRALIDDVTGTDLPEAIMYAIEESGPRLVGVEYFVLGSRIDAVPEILGRPARGPTLIPSVGSIYWQHVWLYDKPADGLFSYFNQLAGCWRE